MTKGEKQRHIHISHKKIIQALNDYIDIIRVKPSFNYHGWLFETQRHSRFLPDVLQKWFRKLYDKAGIKRASSHSGRRTFITRLIKQALILKQYLIWQVILILQLLQVMLIQTQFD